MTRRHAIRRTQQWRAVLVGTATAISVAVATGLGVTAASTAASSPPPTSTSGFAAQPDDDSDSHAQPPAKVGTTGSLVSGGSGQHHAKSSGS